jgi:class 3 adenylate cyclase
MSVKTSTVSRGTRQGFDLRSFKTWLPMVVLVAVAHWIALVSQAAVFSGVTARLFLVPVVYAAIRGGLVGGLLGGLVSGAALTGLMLAHEPMDFEVRHAGHWNSVLIEHLVEAPVFIVLGALTGYFRDHVRREQTQRERTEQLFSRFVSGEVLEEILKRGAVLEGEEAEATVLFADVRGFTTLCERMAPAQVFALLNAFFGEMVAAVHLERGLVDKYIGDAVMAVFGVPIRDTDHALRAVRAATAMLRRLEELNARRFFGDVDLRIGIGIHTGPLMAGHVGCLERMEYTVLGDSVNLASRLQALTRTYDLPLLVSGSTVRSVGAVPGIDFIPRGTTHVKGREGEVEVFACSALR